MPEQKAFDAVGTALGSIITGAAAGGALLCGVLAAAHGMPRGSDTPFARLAVGAAGAGLLLAAALGAALARRLGVWRAAVSAMVAASGTALVGVLTTAADMAAGVAGLLVLMAICAATIVGARRIFFGKEPA